jgi:hypothetical protein
MEFGIWNPANFLIDETFSSIVNKKKTVKRYTVAKRKKTKNDLQSMHIKLMIE